MPASKTYQLSNTSIAMSLSKVQRPCLIIAISKSPCQYWRGLVGPYSRWGFCVSIQLAQRWMLWTQVNPQREVMKDCAAYLAVPRNHVSDRYNVTRDIWKSQTCYEWSYLPGRHDAKRDSGDVHHTIPSAGVCICTRMITLQLFLECWLQGAHSKNL